MQPRVADMEARVAHLLESIAYVTENRELLERRRAEIAEAAYAVIAESGFHDASVNAIAKRVGINKRTLYDYVGDKDDILYLVFLHYLPKLLLRLAGAVNDTDNGLTQLRAMAHEHIGFQAEYPRIGLLYFRELRHLSHDQVAEVLWLLGEFVSMYEAAILRGIDDGTISVSEPHVAARAVATVLDMPSLAGWDVSRYDYDTIEREALSIVVDGLRVRDEAVGHPSGSDNHLPVES